MITQLGKKLNNQEVEEMIQAVHVDADGQVNCEDALPAHPCLDVLSLLPPSLQALLLL